MMDWPKELPADVADDIRRLDELDLYEVRRRWTELYGRPPPRSLRRAFLIKACAYQIKVKAFGGLRPETRRRLREIAEAVRNGTVDRVLAAPLAKPGTQIVRSWREEVHVVTVLENGFEWKGQRFRSLSAIARAITGTNWNGYAFFGLKPRPQRKRSGKAPPSCETDHG